jgi:probable HAF family extracellular repeat protein
MRIRVLARVALGGAVILFPLFAIPAPAGAATSYSIVDIGALGGANGTSAATAINAAGDVAGWSPVSETVVDAVLYKGGVLTDEGTFNQTSSRMHPTAINAADEMVGYFIDDSGYLHAFWLSPKGAANLSPPDAYWSSAEAVNDNGEIVGEMEPKNGPEGELAVRFSPTALGQTSDLGHENHSTDDTAAAGVDAAGLAVGAATGTNPTDAVTFSDGVATVLPGIPGLAGDYYANAISPNGKYIVGDVSTSPGPQTLALAYTPGQPATELGDLPTRHIATAVAVNDNGQAVGSSCCQNGSQAVLFAGGTVTDLNTLIPPGSGWVLGQASGINDAGQIVGEGIHNGVLRGFVMSPPSPAPCSQPAGGLSRILNTLSPGSALAILVCQVGLLLNVNL